MLGATDNYELLLHVQVYIYTTTLSICVPRQTTTCLASHYCTSVLWNAVGLFTTECMQWWLHGSWEQPRQSLHVIMFMVISQWEVHRGYSL